MDISVQREHCHYSFKSLFIKIAFLNLFDEVSEICYYLGSRTKVENFTSFFGFFNPSLGWSFGFFFLCKSHLGIGSLFWLKNSKLGVLVKVMIDTGLSYVAQIPLDLIKWMFRQFLVDTRQFCSNCFSLLYKSLSDDRKQTFSWEIYEWIVNFVLWLVDI